MRDNAVVRGPVDRHPGCGSDGAREQRSLLLIGRTEQSQRANQIGDDCTGPPRRERHPCGIDQGTVARDVKRRVYAREQRRLARAGRRACPSRRFRRHQGYARRRRTHALQLSHILRAVPAAARHGDLEVGLPYQRIECAH